MVELFRPKNCLVVVLGEIYGSELVIVRFSPVVACWPAQKQTHRQRNVSGGGCLLACTEADPSPEERLWGIRSKQ